MTSPPLHELTQTRWLVRKAAITCAFLLIWSLRAAVAVARLARVLCRPSTRPGGRTARVVLTGMFESDAWVEAHVRPLALSQQCEHVWVVTDRAMAAIPKTTYVCAPPAAQRLLGTVPARSLYCLLTTLRVRPHAVGGFHLLLNGIVALVCARLAGARSIYFCVGGWTEIWGGGARSENRLFRLIGADSSTLERSVLAFVQQIDLTITMGTRARQFLRERGVTQPIEVLPGGLDDTRFLPASASDRRLYDAIFVGRLVPIKRVDILLRAVQLLAAEKPEVRVGVVGDGPLRADLERHAVQLGLEKNVVFLGRSSEVAKRLRESRIFVLTSDSEGLALSVMEAMMTGLPAVVSDVGDLGDLVEDGVNGWTVPRRTPEAFAEKLLMLLRDEEMFNSFSRSAQRSAAIHSLQSACGRWDRILGRWAHSPAPCQREIVS